MKFLNHNTLIKVVHVLGKQDLVIWLATKLTKTDWLCCS